ncbi:MAG TPA: nucleotidyltransferase domain-containing protein [Blastocatellia bacterium]|nr:nucleotidyltransferase domain-containing protein [Blastocatellia bacterium]
MTILNRAMGIAEQAVDALKAGLGENLVAVALFGSRARGDERPGSDWDLFVLADRLPEHPLDRQTYLKAMLPLRLATKVSLLAKAPKEFESDLLPVYLDIASDAIILFDPQGYLSAKLQEVREITQRVGLKRRRLNGEWIWDWVTPPRGIWEVNWR